MSCSAAPTGGASRARVEGPAPAGLKWAEAAPTGAASESDANVGVSAC